MHFFEIIYQLEIPNVRLIYTNVTKTQSVIGSEIKSRRLKLELKMFDYSSLV